MNRCSAGKAAAQFQACLASSACIRRGVACPAASASCQHDLRSPGSASSAPIDANAASRDLALGKHPREQPAQLAVKPLQPRAIFCDGTGGHCEVLSCHEA